MPAGPANRPGRSNAESMDAAEHGVTLEDAMAVRLELTVTERGIQDEEYASRRVSCLAERDPVSGIETRRASRVVGSAVLARLHDRFHRRLHCGNRRCSRAAVLTAEAGHAWRERPPRWPRAWQGKGSKRVVAHATGWLSPTAPTAAPRGARHRAPPKGDSPQSAARRGLAAVGGQSRVDPGGEKVGGCDQLPGGNTSRGGGVPPHRSPPCSLRHAPNAGTTIVLHVNHVLPWKAL